MTGVVYFIECSGRIKIGITKNLKARVGALQTSAPGELTVIATVPGSRDLERELHGKLRSHRTTGEWFADTLEVRAAISVAVSQHGGSFDPEIKALPKVIAPQSLPVEQQPEHENWDGVGKLVSARRAAVVHFGEIIDSPAIQDMQRAHEIERGLGVERGSIVRKIYQCGNPEALHLQTLKRINALHEKSIKVGDRITLAIVKQDFSANEGLGRALEVLIEMADSVMAPLKAIHRPIVNDPGQPRPAHPIAKGRVR